MTEFVARIGTFFLLIGMGFAILFIASDMAASSGTGMRTDYNYLCIGVILLSLGFALRAQGRPPPEPSGRFRSIRNYREKRKQARIEKEKAKHQVKK